MPKFFFSSRDSVGSYLDQDGTDLPGAKEAHTQAVVLAGELIKDLALSHQDDTLLAVWVTDDAGQTVCSIDFSSVCERSGNVAKTVSA